MTKKKEKKVDPKVSPYHFDTTKTYIIPMRPNSERLNRNAEAVPTECNIKIIDRAVFVTTPGYTNYIFVDSNFAWYLHTGHIKIKEEDNEEN